MNIIEYLLAYFGIDLDARRDKKVDKKNKPKTTYLKSKGGWVTHTTSSYTGKCSPEYASFFLSHEYPNGINYDNQGINNSQL